PAHVVPAEVDEHHVLGALLRVRLELGLERRVLLGGRAALAGPGDGADGDRLPGEADQELGRGSGQRAIAEAEEEEVRGGRDAAERAVEIERVALVVGGEAPGEDDLVAVAGSDVLACPGDGRLEPGTLPSVLEASQCRRGAGGGE